MTRAAFSKSVRMFRKFSEETLRRRGDNQLGREGVAALSAIDAVLKGERLFDGSLLEPLAAFTNLLQSSQLPPEFGDLSFGDALLAIEEAHAELRQADEQHWEFVPEVPPEQAAASLPFAARLGAADGDASEHNDALSSFVSQGAGLAKTGSALVLGALSAPGLPLLELATRFERLTLSDLDLPALEQYVQRTIPEQLRGKVRLERYDLTGSYGAFSAGVEQAVQSSSDSSQAEQALETFLQSYDVSAGSAGLSLAEERPEFVVSALLLSELGRGYGPCIARAFEARGWDASCITRPPLAPALALFARLIEQHHIQALLRRANRATLISAVSEVALVSQPGGSSAPQGEPRDLLGVERLEERLPNSAQVLNEQSWEWPRVVPAGPAPHEAASGAENRRLLTLVEAVLV